MADNNSADAGKPVVGIILTNLGTPAAPEKKQLKLYLKEFLSDPRVVETPRLLWWLILNGIILKLRPARSAAAYRKIWTQRGSPLLLHTQDQAAALQTTLAERFGNQVVVEYAMRYGAPGISATIEKLMRMGIEKLLVLPLYPQYSGPSTGSSFDAVAADFTRRRHLPELRFLSHYHDHPAYIAALAESIRAYRRDNGNTEMLLFSYHGTPQTYADQGDPYYHQCHQTTQRVAVALGLEDSAYATTFQSRFGRAPWLQPYTDRVLEELPTRGTSAVQIICPGFAADCLETLEEINVENRERFLAAGGKHYDYIPCLNSSPQHIAALEQLTVEQMCGWLAPI